jgi:serine phosphatase RsbU (regulator of sigma subunit)/anti-sigma regulatory factor (Ser/Thr protein kinase)
MEKKTRKKIRLSLISRIALLFLLAFILACVLSLTTILKYLFNEAVSNSSEIANAALIGACDIIWSGDPGLELLNSPKKAEYIHDRFREICRKTGLKYLYFYTMESEDTFRHIVSAADTEENDLNINSEYGFGSVRRRKMYDGEKDIIDGKDDIAEEFVSNEFGYVCMWITPLVDRQGNIRGFIGADYDITDIIKRTKRNVAIFGTVGFLAFFLTFLLSVFLIKQVVTAPIVNLSRRMSRFTKEKKVEPDNRKTLFADEITDIEISFDSMTREIVDYIGNIRELTKEKVQSQTQLEIARRIQLGIAPKESRLQGDICDIYGFCRPAVQVGGDFYDFFKLSDSRVFIAIGDISGKGISAAFFMMMIRSALREKIRAGREPHEALNEINDDLQSKNPESMFSTIFAAILDLEEGVLQYANAGHNAPVIFGKELRELEVDPGIALGLFDESDIRLMSTTMSDGEGIFLYTDGFTEAVNTERKPFGVQGLLDVIGNMMAGGSDIKAGEVAAQVTLKTDEYSEGLEQFDDMTCVSLVYHEPVKKRLTLLPKLSEFTKVREQILSIVSDKNKGKDILLVCDEIFANIVNYSGADEITLDLLKGDGYIKACFRDNGKSFNPVERDTDLPEFENLDSGGMGLILVKQNSREMIYNREDNINVLTLILDD